jgi:hypothetical protein
MLRDLHLRKLFKDIEEWFVGMVIGMRKDMVEIANGLMIMSSEDEVDCFHEEVVASFQSFQIMVIPGKGNRTTVIVPVSFGERR